MLTNAFLKSILSAVVIFTALACGTEEQANSDTTNAYRSAPSGEYLWCGTYAEYGDSIFASERKKSIIANIRNLSLLEVNGIRYLNTGNPYSKDPEAYACQITSNNTLECEGYGIWVKDHELSSEFDQNKRDSRAYPIKVSIDLSTAEQYGNSWKGEMRVYAGGISRSGECSNS